MSDKKAAYKQLLISLKKCELNYHAHVREFGKLGQSEINFWAEQLQDMSAERIERLFDDHIKHSSFFPTVKDIRQGTVENPRRKLGDDWGRNERIEHANRLLADPNTERAPMPDKFKEIFKKLQSDVRKRKLADT